MSEGASSESTSESAGSEEIGEHRDAGSVEASLFQQQAEAENRGALDVGHQPSDAVPSQLPASDEPNLLRGQSESPPAFMGYPGEPAGKDILAGVLSQDQSTVPSLEKEPQSTIQLNDTLLAQPGEEQSLSPLPESASQPASSPETPVNLSMQEPAEPGPGEEGRADEPLYLRPEGQEEQWTEQDYRRPTGELEPPFRAQNPPQEAGPTVQRLLESPEISASGVHVEIIRHESAQLETLIERLSAIPALQPEKWSQASEDERAVALVQAAHTIAEVYPELAGKDTMQVQTADLGLLLGGITDLEKTGYTAIALNTRLASEETPYVAVSVLLHEARHQLQNAAIKMVRAQESAGKLDPSWADRAQVWAQQSYIKPELGGFGRYVNQPQEREAQAFAGLVTLGLYQIEPGHYEVMEASTIDRWAKADQPTA